MRILLLFLVTLSHSTIWAKPQTLLECLGQEEEIIHREKLSKEALLFNQQLISHSFELKNLKIKPRFLKQICQGSKNLFSLNFLEIFLKNKGKVFIKSQTKIINQFHSHILNSLNHYIAISQMYSPNPDCLLSDHKAISTFVFKMLYEAKFLSPKKILYENNLGLKVLKELKNFPQTVKNCPKNQR